MSKELIKKQKCARCSHPFKANTMIKGDNVCGTCQRMNSITFWFPTLLHYEIPVPKTVIVNADIEIGPILDNKKIPGSDRFWSELEFAVAAVGLPAFLRTEMLSNKHEWQNSCFIEKREDLRGHVRNLVEMSHVATIDRRTDYDFFAVREMLKTESPFTYFAGKMPITKELRFFVKNGDIECVHPYWPKKVFPDVDKKLVEKIQKLTVKEKKEAIQLALFISKLFTGSWSVDLLKTKSDGWYCTDMAIGERSYHEKHNE